MNWVVKLSKSYLDISQEDMVAISLSISAGALSANAESSVISLVTMQSYLSSAWS